MMSYRKVPAGNQVAFIVTSQVQCGGRRENKQNQLPAWTFLYDVDSKQRRNLATALTKPFQTFKLQTDLFSISFFFSKTSPVYTIQLKLK